MMVKHDQVAPMIEAINQIMDALLDHDLIVSITTLSLTPVTAINNPLPIARKHHATIAKGRFQG